MKETQMKHSKILSKKLLQNEQEQNNELFRLKQQFDKKDIEC